MGGIIMLDTLKIDAYFMLGDITREERDRLRDEEHQEKQKWMSIMDEVEYENEEDYFGDEYGSE